MTILEVALEGGVAVLRLDRPPVNALDLETVEAIEAGIARILDDPSVRGIVLTGTGANFSAGVDVKAVPGYGPERRQAMIRAINRMVFRLYGATCPVVAAINGHAVGGGLILAMAADFRLAPAGSDLRLGLAEVSAGLPFPAAPLLVLEHEIEPRLGRSLALSGRLIGLSEAHAARLIDEVVAPEALLATAIERVRALARLPGYAPIKAQLRRAVLAAMKAAIDNDSDPLLTGWAAAAV